MRDLGSLQFHRRALLISGAYAATAAMFSASLGPMRAVGAESWPTRSITLIVPVPPGGQAELAALPIAAEISRQLGLDVEISYIAGDGGAVGNAAAAKANPDGGTLLMSLTSVLMLPEGMRLSGAPVTYEFAQLRPIARVLSDPLTLAVRADAPWRDISGFIDDAKAHPGEIAYGSSGAYGTLHTAMGMLQNAADIKLRHQPYLGAGPALKALLKGEVQAVPAAPGLLKKHVAEGRLRVLASWGNQRKQPFPDIPTLHQLDFGRMEFNTWAGLFAPSVLPDSLVVRLRDVVRVAVHQQNMVSIFERAGSPVSYRDAPDFETFVASEQRRFLPILRGMAESEHRVAEDKPK